MAHLPAPPASDPIEVVSRNPEPSSHSCSRTTNQRRGPYEGYIRLGENSVPRNLPALSVPISHVVVVGSQEQVIWVRTPANVALMQNMEAGRDWAAMSDPGKSMGPVVHSPQLEISVPTSRFSPRPQPTAGVGFVFQKAQEPIYVRENV